MERGISAKMILAIIFIWITQIIQMICRRTSHTRICGPVIISFLILNHLCGDCIRIPIRKLNLDLHFKEINKTSNDKRNEDVSPVRCVQIDNVDHHAKHAQYNCMAPQKTYGLDGVIKNILPFMYSLNLHVLLIDIFHVFIIPIQFLKIYVFKREKRDFCVYSEENSLYLLGK